MSTFAMIAIRLVQDALRRVALERGVRPARIDRRTRVSLAVLTEIFDWRGVLVVAQTATMIR